MPFTILLDGEPSEIEILGRHPRLLLRVNGRVYAVDAEGPGTAGTGQLRIDGEITQFARAMQGESQFLRLGGRHFEARVASRADAGGGGGAGADAVKAPMPGVVVRIHKQPGDPVSRGETVITIESMKLQMALAAPRDGVIAELLASEGGGFDKDAVLARLASVGGE